ncbi:MAG: pentapeptide repeat-containing protein [Spirulinaceae cyanobacterium]
MMGSHPQKSVFIATEPLGLAGEAGEQQVWEAICQGFESRNCMGYWRYPIFSTQGDFRKEPDILILDPEGGVIVIEVKSFKIEQIEGISGHLWQYKQYFTPTGNPYQQAERQLFALLKYSDREPQLQGQVLGRALIALPYITCKQWQEKGFHRLPTSPPILFVEDLETPEKLSSKILAIPPLKLGNSLSQKQWELLLAVVGGTALYQQPNYRVYSRDRTRGHILHQMRDRTLQLDFHQDRIAKQIPPGPQRIRGVAGSGKTIVLCQKAAHIHLKYPHWQITLVFFSRSLYPTITAQLDRWLRHFSQNQMGYDPKNRNLRVLHAWGAKQQPGFYSLMCREAGVSRLVANQTQSKQPNESLAEACIDLLKQAAIPQIFDAILIDEGQDLVVDTCKYEGKQPFYWLAYQALRPADPAHPSQRRLIWAYDEAQSLQSLAIPSARELFGDDLGHLVSGQYRNGIPKTEILSRCYRTPHAILTAAHAIAMGLLRPHRILTGLTHSQEWQALGYKTTPAGQFFPGDTITLQRPSSHSPNPIPELWGQDYIQFKVWASRQQELSNLAQNLIQNLRYDGLRPSQQILVIVLGSHYEAKKLETQVANFLMQQGLEIYIPGTADYNILQVDKTNYHPNQFWCDGAITISRIHRAKGHEADMVYLVGLDLIAQAESNLHLRNQLLVGLTRARGWVHISGINAYPLYAELRQVLHNRDTFTFHYQNPPQREIMVTDAGELLSRYAKGDRNFCYANLENIELPQAQLPGIDLIGANLRGANLQNANLEGAKLVTADLEKADLTGANLRKAKLIGANLENCKMDGVNWDLSDFEDL